MKSLAKLRADIYNYNYGNYPYLKNWKKNPYTWFKAKFYMEMSTILAYLLLKTKIKANTVTVIYALLGIFGGIFLAIPYQWIIILGVLIFYLRGILDWTDGVVARERNQTSVTGDILDTYGASTGWVCLWVGLSLYIIQKSFVNVAYISPDFSRITLFLFHHFIYALPVIPTFFALDIIIHAKHRLYTNHISRAIQQNLEKKQDQKASPYIISPVKSPKAKKIMQVLNAVFDHRARFVDFICLVIVLELMFPALFISWIIFMLFLCWKLVCFIAFFIVIARGGQVEKYLDDTLEEIHRF